MLIREFRYRPEIDGLRAIAVGAVVLYHAGLGFPGGFAGVDVFFVISGYLITSLIVRDLEAKTFSMARFWQRRIRRIFPAMAVMVVAVLVAGWFLMLPADYARLAQSAIWQTFFAANISLWLQTEYFAPAAEEQPLLHTWSLAVEEQFYLIVPAALALLFTFAICRQRKYLMLLLAAATAVSFVWSVYGVARYPSATFYLLPTRAWELSLGSMVALLPQHVRSPKNPRQSIVALIGLLLILFSFFAYSNQTPFPGVAALVPCVGTSLFIWGSNLGVSSLTSVMSCASAVFVGKISYSLYLWHWPVFAFATYLAWDPLSLPMRIALVAASAVLAVVSYNYVEQPFRLRKLLPRDSQMPPFLAFFSLVLAGAGVFILATGGAPFRLEPKIVAYAADAISPEFSWNPGPDDVRARKLRTLGVAEKNAPRIDLIVWGDSHAMTLADAFDEFLKSRGLSGLLAARLSNAPVLGAYWRGNGQPPAENERCVAFNDSVFELIKRTGVKHVVLVGNWEMYGDDKSDSALSEGLPETVQRLRDIGTEVYIMLQIPNQHFDVPKYLGLAAITGRDISPKLARVDDYAALGSLDRSALSLLEAKGAHLLNPSVLLLKAHEENFAAQKDGKTLYFDGTHLTPRAARDLFLPFLSDNLAIEKNE